MTKKNFLILIFIALSSLYLYAFSGGITGTTRKNGTGCTCHGISSQNVTVRIIGPDTIAINDSASFIIKLSGGSLLRGGTNIAAKKGILVAGQRLRVFNDELTHSSPLISENDTVTINFKYKAPSSAGTDTIFANGNSVNFDGFTTGDNWNFAPNKKIEIVNPTTIINLNITPGGYNLKQNFPNPFNPGTNLEFGILNSGFVSLKIYDMPGKEVVTIVNANLDAGTYKYYFDATGLTSGIYFYQIIISTERSQQVYRERKKMLLLK